MHKKVKIYEDIDDKPIQTFGCDNLQKRNKLKGIALQKLILPTIINKKEDISINEILKIVLQKSPEYYTVESEFKTQSKLFNIKHEFIHYSELDEELNVYLKEEIVSKKWKQCSNIKCKCFILSEKQQTKKCKKCNKGFFKYLTKKYDNWNLYLKGNREEIINKLIENGYLKKVKISNKRADFFYFSNNTFYIYESKNKEISGLRFKDLYSTLIYPLILKQCGYDVKELTMIYNGDWTDDLMQQIQKGYGEKYDFNISFYPIKKYLKDNKIDVRQINIKQINGTYQYDIIYGNLDNNRLSQDIAINIIEEKK